MNTVSGTAASLAVTLLVIVGIISCSKSRNEEFAGQKFMFVLKLGKETNTHTEYAELSDKLAFDKALDRIPKDQYHIRFLRNDQEKPIDPYYPDHRPLNVQVDKVTTSETASSGSAGESAANDPHATYRIQSNDPNEVKSVLDAFAKPSPTPTH